MNIDVCRRVLLLDDEANDNNDNHQQGGNNNNGQSGGESSSQLPTEDRIKNEYKRRMLSSLCDIPLESLDKNARPKALLSFRNEMESLSSSNGNKTTMKRRSRHENPFSHDTLRVLQQFDQFGTSSAIPPRTNRNIPNKPAMVLDVYDIVDDFYLNLMSWSEDNILAVAFNGKALIYKIIYGF